MKVTWYSTILLILSGLHAIVSETSVTINVEPKDGIICPPHETVSITCSTNATGLPIMLCVIMDGICMERINSINDSVDGRTWLFIYPNATNEVAFQCSSPANDVHSSGVIHVTYKVIPAVSDLSVCKDTDSNEFIMSWTPPTSSDIDYYRLSINDHSEEIYQNDSLSLNLTSMVPDNQITVGISPVLGECKSLSNYTYLNVTLADIAPCTGESSGDTVMESSLSEGHSSTLSTPVTQTNQHTHPPSSSSIVTASSDIISSSTQHSQQIYPSTTPTMMNANNVTGSDGQITTVITATVVPLVVALVGVIVCIVVGIVCLVRRSRNILCKESQQHRSAEHDISISTKKSHITYADRDVNVNSTTLTDASEVVYSSDEEHCNSIPAVFKLPTEDLVPDGGGVRQRQAPSISLQNTS